jgi:hypothetical protein
MFKKRMTISPKYIHNASTSTEKEDNIKLKKPNLKEIR